MKFQGIKSLTNVGFWTPKCPNCNSSKEVIDNGDGWYCYECNSTFNGD